MDRGNRGFYKNSRASGVIASLISLFVCVAAAQSAGEHSNQSADQLVSKVITNELRAEQQDHSHWAFRLDTHKLSGETETDEVVEAKVGDLKEPILFNGHQLTTQQRQLAEKRIRQLERDPGPLQKARKDEDEDSERSQRLLKMLPTAFHFTYGERRGDLIELNFTPNPSFHPSSHEAEVFHDMKGEIWVDTHQLRLAEISGQLMREVKFGGGILGYLDKGGTFEVKQAQVAPDYWELTFLKVEMKGRALFFKTIGVQQFYTRSHFKQVPDNLTLAAAEQMLEKNSNQAEARAKSDGSQAAN